MSAPLAEQAFRDGMKKRADKMTMQRLMELESVKTLSEQVRTTNVMSGWLFMDRFLFAHELMGDPL